MISYVLKFQEVDKTRKYEVGGKGVNIGELMKMKDIKVPEGFCVTTDAYRKAFEHKKELNILLDQLAVMKIEDQKRISEACRDIRSIMLETDIPPDVMEAVSHAFTQFGDKQAYAVRSSATAEDLPYASFAGQQETYLNVIGREAVLWHISRCWASLFTDRAVMYRMQNGFDHRQVCISVIIQKMACPQASGVLFTADPVTSNRRQLAIDAVFGLGDALVAGLVPADHYKIQDGEITKKMRAVKKTAVYGSKEGGTEIRQIAEGQQKKSVLTDEQIGRLERIGRQVETHFGSPQDIEWCLEDDVFYVVQSRPITTLYPIPETEDAGYRVYVSVGHQQMMTDPIKPLGLSFFLLTTYAPMHKAGGRLFVDVSKSLNTPTLRDALVNTLGESDPLIKDALMTIIERGGITPLQLDDTRERNADTKKKKDSFEKDAEQSESDPVFVSELIKGSEASIEKAKQHIQTISGSDVFDFILEDIQELKKYLFDPHSLGVITTAMNASAWINKYVNKWLGEKNAADVLSQSAAYNITSEMGLELLDTADVIRPYPEVIDCLERAKDNSFLEELLLFDGGEEAKSAIDQYLRKYGMRCAGEIDITRARWSENPLTLVSVLLNTIKNFEPGASFRKFEKGKQEALKKEQDILRRLKELPDGEQKAAEAKQKIDLIRHFIGYREYPKYAMVNRYFLYKQALLKEADKLVQAGIIQEKEDVYYLTFKEFQEVVRVKKLAHSILHKRKEEYGFFEKLTPPRVITSNGEIINGKYRRGDFPSGSVVGLPVSSGIIEGRARVISTMEKADVEEGDILITTYTDPSWTPLFLLVKGLVTEVGGLMTHGAVVAREYGLPAVVGVENAVSLIKDGQRIRVNGTEGYIEIL